jgi:hypothetical protein
MKITVERFKSNDDATASLIYIDGIVECFGLEDEYREFKIPGETRIPSGTYPVVVRVHGGYHERYTRKFGDFHKGMLEVANVQNFTDILVHSGNTDDHTNGCLLTGTGCMLDEDITVQASVAAYKRLYAKVIEAALADDLYIQYVDNDREPAVWV